VLVSPEHASIGPQGIGGPPFYTNRKKVVADDFGCIGSNIYEPPRKTANFFERENK